MHLDCRAPSEAPTILDELVRDEIAAKIMAQNPTLWGAAAEEEAVKRLSWVSLAVTSRPLLAEIEALGAQLREEGLDRIVLCGMGGSSLAPEVICATDGVPLTTLDSTDPGQVAAAFATGLDRTVLIVASKSGTTVETDSHRRYAEQRFTEAGIDPASRMVVITDPGSPLQQLAEQAGYRKVFEADPDVGGRYSALTAFGLVPAGLAGADISGLLDDAAEAGARLGEDSAQNPALRLAAVLGAAERSGAEKVVIAPAGSANIGLGNWMEQLIAESTGKEGRGILPVVVEGTDAPGYPTAGPDAVKVALGPGPAPSGGSEYAVATDGPLGAQFLLWEMAVAVASRIIEVNPFDQPDVEEAKRMARAVLDAPEGGSTPPATVCGPELTATATFLGADQGIPVTLDEAVNSLLAAVPDGGYVAVMAYLDRLADTDVLPLRGALCARARVQTTFGWGPRFLHSTGQYHKGGHPNGVFLQITADCAQDAPVPGRPYTFRTLQLAQAAGDARVLTARGLPLLQVHLKDRRTGIAALLAAVTGR